MSNTLFFPTAACVIRMLRDHHQNVPVDISVLGVDNSPTFNSLYPDLTTLEYPVADLAQHVLDFLTQGKTDFPFQPMKIIERKTVYTTLSVRLTE